MTDDALTRAGESLRNVAGALAERHRQLGQGASGPFDFLEACVAQEAFKLRTEGHGALADALLALVEADNA